MWCSAADTHLQLLASVVSGGSFLAGSGFQCDLAYRQSVAVLCMLCYGIVMYTTRSGVVFMLLYLSSMCGAGYTRFCDRTSVHLCACSLKKSQYRRFFITLPVSLWNDLGDQVFDGVGFSGFKSRANAFLMASSPIWSLPFSLLLFSLSLLSFYMLALWCWSLRPDIGC